MAAPGTPGGWPICIIDHELGGPPPDASAFLVDGVAAAGLWVVARQEGVPVGKVEVSLPAGGLGPAEFAAAVDPHAAGNHYEQPRPRPERQHVTDGPAVTVVVCTREHPAELARCLASLFLQDYPRTRILVVDNAPTTTRTRELVERMAASHNVAYALAELPGLSRARNHAMTLVLTPLVAWIDDDEIADPSWVSELVRAFTVWPAASAVSGLVLPGELRTESQVLFEMFGGHSKGRGYRTWVFAPGGDETYDPLFPLPPFGVGANMAFRTADLRELGAFDEVLGAGTITMGGEDTQMFTRLLLAGLTSVFYPAAVTRHFHRPDFAGLEKQLYGYGVGLTAFYTSMVLARPAILLKLVALAPRAIGALLGPGSTRNSGVRNGFPESLMRLNRRGMLLGPATYLRARRLARAQDRARP